MCVLRQLQQQQGSYDVRQGKAAKPNDGIYCILPLVLILPSVILWLSSNELRELVNSSLRHLYTTSPTSIPHASTFAEADRGL